jgi:hypothetical protein
VKKTDRDGNNAAFWAAEKGHSEFLKIREMPPPESLSPEQRILEMLAARAERSAGNPAATGGKKKKGGGKKKKGGGKKKKKK